MRKRFFKAISVTLAWTLIVSSEWTVLASEAGTMGQSQQAGTVSANVPVNCGEVIGYDEEGLAITYTGTAQKAVNSAVVYTAKTKSNLDTSGDGSKENPYNRFEDAVTNVSDGGTIYIMTADGGFLNAQDELGNEPFVIDKSVTIEPEPGADCATLDSRAAGIILGGNVTFKNIQLDFANKYHDVIAANGYQLVLDNVSHSSGSRLVDLVAGSLYDKDSGTRLGPEPGSNGVIEVRGSGSWFGNLYGGSLNGSFTGNSSIVVEGSNGMDIGEIYASGAAEPVFDRSNWFDFTEVEPPAADAVNYPVSGTVTITLKNAPITKVDGSGSGGGTKLNYETMNLRTPELINLAQLNVNKGTLEPTVLTAQDGNGLSLSVAAEGVLDLSQVKSMTAAAFSGGGKLVLDKESTLTVSGDLTGTTILETTGGYNGHSGIAVNEQVYVKAGANTTGTFTFTPNPAQSAYELIKQEDGSWQMINSDPGTGEVPTLTNLRIEETGRVVTYSQINGYNNQYVSPFTMYLDDVPEEAYAWNYPFEYEVVYDNKTYTAISYNDYPSDKYVSDLHMAFSVYGEEIEDGILDAQLYINIYLDESDSENDPIPVATGDYKITVSYPTENGEVSDTLYLTVVEDTTDEDTKLATTTTAGLDATGKTFGENVTVSVSVTADGVESTAMEAKLAGTALQLYVNGKAVGGTVSYEEIKAGSAVLAVTTANGFVEGSNSIGVEFKGSTELIGSLGTAALTVAKAEPTAAYGTKTEYVYDGKAHPLEVTASAVESSIAVPVTITYNGTKEEPKLPGTYTTYVTMGETAVSKERTVAGPNIVISKADPEISLSHETQTDGKTLISVVVDGVTGGMTPVGTITLYQNGAEAGSEVLRYGQADFSITPAAGENKIYAVYQGATQSCYLDKTSETITVTGTGSTEEQITVTNKSYPTAYTYTTKAVQTPTAADFETNGSGTYTFTWYQGTSTTGTALTAAPSVVGSYRLKVELKKDGAVSASLVIPVTISYLTTDKTATLGLKNKGENGWYVGDVTVKAPDGYSIADTSTGSNGWKSELTVTKEGTTAFSYYLRESSTGYITGRKTITVLKDSVRPVLSGIALSRGRLTDTTAELTVNAGESGTLYYVVRTEAAAPETDAVLQGTAKAVSAGANTISVNGLSAGTEYTFYAVAKDKAGNVTADMTSLKFKTQQPGSLGDLIYTDVRPNAWYYDSVFYVYKNNIMNGIGNNRFDPNGLTTRAMVVQILYNHSGRPERSFSNRFEDVAAGSWYAKAVEWAADTKVTLGVSPTCFAPERSVTRQEVACFIYSYAKWMDCDTSGRGDLSAYQDKNQIASWARDAMQWVNYEGIMNGKTSTTLDPTGMATRAEIAAMMKRFMEKQ